MTETQNMEVDTSNYVWLCMTANGWGWSEKSEREAITACRDYMGREHVRKYGYVTYRVHPDFEINQVHGDIYTPKGHPIIRVNDHIVKRKK